MVFKRFWIAAALLLALAGTAAPEETPDAEAMPKPIYTRQGKFAIPFRIETPAANISPPVKVRLFVSENEGRNWHLEGEVKPTEQRFDFPSSHDGEYWFTIRSVDAQGRSYPDGAYDPQLRVIVDTLAPRLDLRAERGADGEVTAHWDVVDPAIDPATFKLEYQSAGGAWQTLAIEPQSQHLAKLTLVGETLWWPPAGSGKIVLRASVTDRAGNPAVSQFQLDGSTPLCGSRDDGCRGPQSVRKREPAGAKLLEWPAEPTAETLGRSVPGTAPGGGRRSGQDSAWRMAKGGALDRNSNSSAGPRSLDPDRRAGNTARRIGQWCRRVWLLAGRRAPHKWSIGTRSSWTTRSRRWAIRASPKSNCGARATAAGIGNVSDRTTITAAPWWLRSMSRDFMVFASLSRAATVWPAKPRARATCPKSGSMST